MIKEFIKPKAPIINADGNIFNLMGIASRSLKDNGYYEQSKEMISRITSCHSYNEALQILDEYIEPCTQEEMELEEDMELYDEMEFE